MVPTVLSLRLVSNVKGEAGSADQAGLSSTIYLNSLPRICREQGPVVLSRIVWIDLLD
jgi:hypothetical protein